MTSLIAKHSAELALLLLFLSVGCSTGAASEPVDIPEGAAKKLTVSAASDLRFAFEELGQAFQEETGVQVTFNFGSTGQLAQQIERGAPVDVFAAANVSFIEDLENRGLIIPDTRALYAQGFIVLWTREDSPYQFQQMGDVIQPGVRRVAIANPEHAPYGMAARQALQSAGVWEEVQPRLVLGENVSQTLQYAQTGNVDAAIVALSLAIVVEGGRYTKIPQELHQPIDQALAVVQGTRHERQARAFAEFVNGPTGRPILRRYGFVLPGDMLQ